eukprot:TRINITY_DN39693_c0_g1_i2.p1 TRINITY_DN39693_c0_g1~~TRINITY_DN39693_c0_g1_i2.p1  ORF type:complete len:131 (-),score=30.45 TRINITY_DN39693_c0_g1_i2:105-497(-)
MRRLYKKLLAMPRPLRREELRCLPPRVQEALEAHARFLQQELLGREVHGRDARPKRPASAPSTGRRHESNYLHARQMLPTQAPWTEEALSSTTERCFRRPQNMDEVMLLYRSPKGLCTDWHLYTTIPKLA